MPSASAASAMRNRGVRPESLLDLCLLNFQKLIVEMFQCRRQYFPVTWIVRGFKVMNNTCAG